VLVGFAKFKDLQKSEIESIPYEMLGENWAVSHTSNTVINCESLVIPNIIQLQNMVFFLAGRAALCSCLLSPGY
jgi:hypothetical protein